MNLSRMRFVTATADTWLIGGAVILERKQIHRKIKEQQTCVEPQKQKEVAREMVLCLLERDNSNGLYLVLLEGQ